jgi:hypothetical protein
LSSSRNENSTLGHKLSEADAETERRGKIPIS